MLRVPGDYCSLDLLLPELPEKLLPGFIEHETAANLADKPDDGIALKLTISEKPFNRSSVRVEVVESPTLSGPSELGDTEMAKSDNLNGTRMKCVRPPPVPVMFTV